MKFYITLEKINNIIVNNIVKLLIILESKNIKKNIICYKNVIV